MLQALASIANWLEPSHMIKSTIHNHMIETTFGKISLGIIFDPSSVDTKEF